MSDPHTGNEPGQQVIRADDAGLRLDTYLARAHHAPSTSAARRMVAAGLVRVNGKVAKKGYSLCEGDVLDLDGSRPDLPAVAPAPEVRLEILFEDAWIVAVNKPAGIASHPLRPDETGTLAGGLVSRFPECAMAALDPREGGLAHRLDRGTSGVLVAARSREAWYRLRESLSDSVCVKTYLVELAGSFPLSCTSEFAMPGPTPHSFVVTAPIGRHGRRGEKVVLDGGRNPLPARTEFRLVETRAASCLAEARLSKGRTHQVRAHAAALGTPVWGDEVYGVAADGLRLHAFEVSFVHPFTTQALLIQAPGPSWSRPSG